MEAEAFDRWTRLLGGTAARRNVLGVAAGLGLTVAAGLLSPLADAKRKKKKKKKKASACTRCGCGDGFKPCGDMCIANPDCCANGLPGCAESRACCVENGQGVCRNTDADENHCGGCGDAFACNDNERCVGGACQPVCAPECPAGRACLADPRSGDGTCACATHEECREERNHGGNVCLYANGNSGPKICRCNATSWYGNWPPERDTPCAPGETCSNCCTNQYCQAVFEESPGSFGYVCAPTPKDSYWPRFCCKRNWELCVSWSQCCSGDCLAAGFDEVTGDQQYRCLCTPPGTSCLTDLECCRGKCDIETETCVCFPIEHECTEDAECCSGLCDDTTDKCACEQEPCDCALPMAPCTEDGDCCRGVCRDTNRCA